MIGLLDEIMLKINILEAVAILEFEDKNLLTNPALLRDMKLDYFRELRELSKQLDGAQ